MPPPLSSDDRRRLLLLARNSLAEFILHDRMPGVSQLGSRLAEPGSAFVTLHHRGRLRGCVGLYDRGLPLSEAVVQAALSAARHDPRFAPIRSEELAEVEIEISVLSDAWRIAPDSIEAGKHGLLVIRGKNRGLLLPQVAAEHSWSARRFLEETCLKADLPADAWQDSDTELLAFTADVFSEREFDPAAMAAVKDRSPSRKPETTE